MFQFLKKVLLFFLHFCLHLELYFTWDGFHLLWLIFLFLAFSPLIWVGFFFPLVCLWGYYQHAVFLSVSFSYVVEGEVSYPHVLMIYMQAFVDGSTCRKILGKMRTFCMSIYSSLRTKLLAGSTPLRFCIEVHAVLQLLSKPVGKKYHYHFSPPGCQPRQEHHSCTSIYRIL